MDAHADMEEGAGETDPDEAPMPMPDDAGRIPVDNNYKAYTERFDEIIKAEDLRDADELIRLRQLLDQQLLSLQHATRSWPIACSVALWRSKIAPGNSTLKKAFGCRRLTQVVVDPMNPWPTQEKETKFRDTVVTLLIDGSGSMRAAPLP